MWNLFNCYLIRTPRLRHVVRAGRDLSAVRPLRQAVLRLGGDGGSRPRPRSVRPWPARKVAPMRPAPAMASVVAPADDPCAPVRTHRRRPLSLQRPARRAPLARLEVDTARSARSQYGVVPVPRITKEDLKQRLDSGTPLVVIDARLKYPYEHSTVKLPGAIRLRRRRAAPSLPRDQRHRRLRLGSATSWPARTSPRQLIRQGYRAVDAQGRHRRVGGRETADRNERSAQTGDA